MSQNKRVAVLTGVNGQDGSYLAEFLLSKNYNVIGLVRRSSTNTHERINHIINKENFILAEADLCDPSSINHIINRYKPDECYNLAAQSHVATSFEQPNVTFQVNAVGVLNILEAIRHFSPHTRFYQASTSEMFGSNYVESKGHKYQDERTVFGPNSPYAVSKVAAHNMVILYRKSYDLHASCGILFNHESERRGENFVTRKITKYVGKLGHYRKSSRHLEDIALGRSYQPLALGNLDACRDWGYAPDFIQAIYLMLQQPKPGDYVVGTGRAHSVRDFLDAAFAAINIKDWSKYVVVDPKFYRPVEVEFLKCDPSKAKEQLGWEAKTSFEELVRKMVTYDMMEACNGNCSRASS